jgi:hypothetical protein
MYEQGLDVCGDISSINFPIQRLVRNTFIVLLIRFRTLAQPAVYIPGYIMLGQNYP